MQGPAPAHTPARARAYTQDDGIFRPPALRWGLVAVDSPLGLGTGQSGCSASWWGREGSPHPRACSCMRPPAQPNPTHSMTQQRQWLISRTQVAGALQQCTWSGRSSPEDGPKPKVKPGKTHHMSLAAPQEVTFDGMGLSRPQAEEPTVDRTVTRLHADAATWTACREEHPQV